MSETPSHRRRKGYQAFHPGEDPMMVQPYQKGTWAYDFYLQDWLDGWKQAERDHEREQQELDVENV